MPDFSSVLSVSSFILSVAAGFFAARAATVVRELRDQLLRFPLSRLQSLETSRDELVEQLTDLTHRFKMMKVRNAARHGEGPGQDERMPDPYRDPDGWRTAMNSKLRKAKLGL